MSNPIAIIPCADYLAQCRFASTEETRYYLNGVFVDTVNNRLVATDGHRLGLLAMGDTMWTDKAQPHVSNNAGSFILSASKAVMAAAKPSNRACQTWFRCYADRVDVLEFSVSIEPDPATLQDAAMVVRTIPASVAYVDGTFPDYEKVIPDSYALTVGPLASFNARYMGTFANPLTKNDAMVSILADGAGSPALVFNSDERFLGVLMPMRGPDVDHMRARAANRMNRPEPMPELAIAA